MSRVSCGLITKTLPLGSLLATIQPLQFYYLEILRQIEEGSKFNRDARYAYMVCATV